MCCDRQFFPVAIYCTLLHIAKTDHLRCCVYREKSERIPKAIRCMRLNRTPSSFLRHQCRCKKHRKNSDSRCRRGQERGWARQKTRALTVSSGMSRGTSGGKDTTEPRWVLTTGTGAQWSVVQDRDHFICSSCSRVSHGQITVPEEDSTCCVRNFHQNSTR